MVVEGRSAAGAVLGLHVESLLSAEEHPSQGAQLTRSPEHDAAAALI